MWAYCYSLKSDIVERNRCVCVCVGTCTRTCACTVMCSQWVYYILLFSGQCYSPESQSTGPAFLLSMCYIPSHERQAALSWLSVLRTGSSLEIETQEQLQSPRLCSHSVGIYSSCWKLITVIQCKRKSISSVQVGRFFSERLPKEPHGEKQVSRECDLVSCPHLFIAQTTLCLPDSSVSKTIIPWQSGTAQRPLNAIFKISCHRPELS